MTDHIFTDEELEKTLHICSHYAGNCSDFCPLRYEDECVQTMAKHALALIIRQRAESTRLITLNSQLEARVCVDRCAIEKLQAIHADMNESLRLASEANKDMQAEIERLKDYNENLLSANTALSNEILDIKAEAIKEFAKRLKKSAFDCDVSFGYGREHYTEAVTTIEIDRLVKEMTEENNESQNT